MKTFPIPVFSRLGPQKFLSVRESVFIRAEKGTGKTPEFTIVAENLHIILPKVRVLLLSAGTTIKFSSCMGITLPNPP
jgi:hypothetical protein